jgi:hypothetical protein
MFQTLRASFASMAHRWRIALLQLLLLPILGLAFVVWLWIPEAHWWQLLLSLLCAVSIALGMAWLQAATIRRYSETSAAVSLRTGIGSVVAVLIWLIIFFVLLHFMKSLDDLGSKLTAYWYSKLPATVRPRLTYVRFANLAIFVLSTLYWYIVPAVLIPLGIIWASDGYRRARYRNWGATLLRLRYWLLLAPAALIAAQVPKVMDWKPGKSVDQEIVSLALRLAFVFTVTLLCWLFGLAMAARVGQELEDAHSSPQPEIGGKPAPEPA